MIATERRDLILRMLRERGVITLKEAVEAMGASLSTSQRDFDAIADSGAAERVRGGIRALGGNHTVPSFLTREVRNSAEKSGIARRAALLPASGDVIFVDGGTTTHHLAYFLPKVKLKIITNSLRFAICLEERAAGELCWEIFLCGGFLYPQSGLLVGPAAQAGLSQYRASWAFLSTGGVCNEGVFNTSELVVEAERIMIANAEKVVVMADHNKIGRASMCKVCGLDDVDMIACDLPEGSEDLAFAREAGVSILSS